MKKIINHLKEEWYKYGLETLVVVVGILVAFSLNNWNESRKSNISELKSLIEINASLKDIETNIEFSAGWDSVALVATRNIVNHIANDLPYHDSIAQDFEEIYYAIPLVVQSGAYETLQSKGLDLISNDSIRNKIITIYDVTIQYLFMLGEITSERISHAENTIMLEHFTFQSERFGDSSSGFVPLDYEKLLEDQKFETVLRHLEKKRNFDLIIKLQQLKEIQITIEDISKEIKSLE